LVLRNFKPNIYFISKCPVLRNKSLLHYAQVFKKIILTILVKLQPYSIYLKHRLHFRKSTLIYILQCFVSGWHLSLKASCILIHF
jgi:hypothetical protein